MIMNQFQNKFDQCLTLFSEAKDKTGSELSMFAFAADSDGLRANHLFQNEDKFADLRSVSKVVTALVLGNLILNNKKIGSETISLETRIEPLLTKYMSDVAREQWRTVRIVDLLNNTIGHHQGFL